MKSKCLSALLVLAALTPLFSQEALAQLTPDQRVFDFQNLVALYAKRYAPYAWKNLALGFNMFDVQPWFDRIRAAKSDLEFFEIEAEYVGKLQDTHTAFQMNSTFRADLGFFVDIYDDKVLIDSINRARLPIAAFPFAIGDELVSVDGVSSEEWISRISVWRQYGNPVTTRRTAAQQITLRTQNFFPRAAEIGEAAVVVIRRANGILESYTIPWLKTGVAVTDVPVTPFYKQFADAAASNDLLLERIQDSIYKIPDNDPAYVLNIGARQPIFAAGLPSNFVQRLGRLSTDFHFSGTYVANGLTIGFLRIPSFATPTTALIEELNTEIEYLQRNTDGLVVDVTRNPGGTCYMIDVAARLIPYPFYFFGEEIRATQGLVNGGQAQLELARNSGAPQSVIDYWASYTDKLKKALAEGRLTEPIAACAQFGSPLPTMNHSTPASTVYTRPMIILTDQFSISAADIFPAMIQDNKRAPIVGTRTSGGGGRVSGGWPAGYYSDGVSSYTLTLVVRKEPIVTPDLPPGPYVENIGIRPEIQLDYMTRENLINGGRPYVETFTQILTNRILSVQVSGTVD